MFSCLLQGGVRALMCAPLMLPVSGAWAEVSQLLQWFVNDIYPCYSRVLRVYWSACGRLNAVAGWWAWTEVGQLFLNTVVCEWFLPSLFQGFESLLKCQWALECCRRMVSMDRGWPAVFKYSGLWMIFTLVIPGFWEFIEVPVGAWMLPPDWVQGQRLTSCFLYSGLWMIFTLVIPGFESLLKCRQIGGKGRGWPAVFYTVVCE